MTMRERTEEGSEIEAPSRRSFLGMSSIALASAAMVNLTANAQQLASTQRAEKDHD
jgi:hypothetical protein